MSDDTKINTSQDSAQDPQTEDVTAEETVTEEVVEETTTTDTTPLETVIPSNEKTQASFKSGDTIRVHYRIVEGAKTRIQPYEGIVISRRGKETSKSFTVRRIGADNIGVERIFPLLSPNIEKIDVLKRGKVRKSKLYYLREKLGREAMRIRELGK